MEFETLYRSIPIRKTIIRSLLLALYASLPWLKEHSRYHDVADFSDLANAAYAFSLSIMLVFLLNHSYDRWWEARKHLGKLVNVSRNLAIKLKTITQIPRDDLVRLFSLIQSFPLELKNHLLPDNVRVATEQHRPNQIVTEIYNIIYRQNLEAKLSEVQYLQIDSDLREFLEVCGACERIRNTRIPSAIRTASFLMVWFYLLFMPWGMIGALTDFVFLATFVVAVLILSIFETAVILADPFTGHYDSMDFHSIDKAIRIPTSETLNFID